MYKCVIVYTEEVEGRPVVRLEVGASVQGGHKFLNLTYLWHGEARPRPSATPICFSYRIYVFLCTYLYVYTV